MPIGHNFTIFFSELVNILLAKTMNADAIEDAPSVSSTEIKEAIKDNLPPTKLKRDNVGKVSSRTLAYTLAMVLVVFWLATLNIAFIPRIKLINRTGGEHIWAYVNDMLKNLIIYLFVPLLIILPPILERKIVRLCLCLVLTVVGLLLLLAQVLSLFSLKGWCT